MSEGAKYALAIGASCACVGLILGTLTLSGLGFKFSGAVIDLAAPGRRRGCARSTRSASSPRTTRKVFFGLLFVAIACILMGTGIPTTPTYIILASIAAPALATLGVPLLATHFFVFYYGVLADVTPPVALAAYAAAGIAGSEPMRTGLTAFRLSMGKALVPFMFVYTPALLFIDFTWSAFVSALVAGVIGIVALSAAYIALVRDDDHAARAGRPDRRRPDPRLQPVLAQRRRHLDRRRDARRSTCCEPARPAVGQASA